MSSSRNSFGRSTLSPRVTWGVGASTIVVLLAGAAPSSAAESCLRLRGSYVEHAVQGPDCRSTVGLCIAGTYSGQLRGAFEGRASSIVATADTQTTSVALFTSDSTITGEVQGRS